MSAAVTYVNGMTEKALQVNLETMPANKAIRHIA